MDNDDHNFYNAHPRPPSSVGYEASSDYVLDDDDNDDDIDQQHTQYNSFPSTTDSQPSHISNLSTAFEQYASNASLNGFTSEPPQLAGSPDPHDFYRSYRDLYRGGLGEDLVGSDNVFGGRDDGMTTSRSQRSVSANHRPNGYSSSPLSSRYNNRSDRHATSSPLPEKPSTAIETSDSQFSANVRPGQPSLRALVNKFNQNRDEVPPIPSKPGSRSTSVNASPAKIYGPKSFRSRVPAEMAGSGQKTMARTIPIVTGRSEAMALQSPRKRIARERSTPTIATVTSPRASRKPVPVSSNTYASQSMTDLNSKKLNAPQKPLFGEVVPVNGTTLDPGYGIPGGRRRRGSEGSMHTPNPMFTEDRNASYARVSPSSPTAWYLGVTPSLEGINLDKPIPARPTGGMHQRSRSDFTGSTSRPPLLSSLGKPITIMSPPQEQVSPLMSPLTAKRHSQSRIPISTRRPSVTSDSGNSSPSTRANSFVGQSAVYRKPIVNGVNTFTNPKPGAKLANADHQAALSSSRRSPRHRNLSPIRAQARTSPRLKAFISEAQPMKSPPLRSSRPRQPVSTATTSASRARAADRVADNASRNSSKTRDPKQKKPPELGNVDFAARRQRIQQAFTKTVEENRRKGEIEAEKRRSSLVSSSHQVLEVVPQTEQTTPEGPFEDASRTDPIGLTNLQDQLCTNSPWETPKSKRELTINTAPLSERSVLDLSQEDSPTLGVANRFLTSRQFQQDSPTPPSEEDPASAVTTGTAETFFDNEPQDETPGSNEDHRTLLNQVMDLRKPSPGELGEPLDPLLPSVSLEDSTSASDRDDRESIQIMLGATPISETANAKGTLQMDEEADTVIEPDGKWTTNVTAPPDHEPRHEPLLDRGRDGIAQTDLTRELNPPGQGVSGHVSMSTDASGSSQPMWSPNSMSSLLSERTTLDSDSYNTINRVLDSYHESIRMPSETITDIQQRLFSQSPDIARRGEWDPRKTTQIYLEALRKTNYTQQKVVPEPLNVTGRKSDEVVQFIPPIREEYADAQRPEAEVEEETDMDGDRCEEVDSHDPSIADGLEVIDTPLNPQRASLNHPDDFTNTSPSLLDWMHRQQPENFTEDNTLLSPTKYMGPGGSGVYEKSDISETDRPRTPQFLSEDAQTSLPDIPRTGGGLGILDINVESPHDGSFPSELHPAVPGESTQSVIHATLKRKTPSSPPDVKTPPPPTITYIRHHPPGMGSVTESPPQEPGTATIFPSSSEVLGATRELVNPGITSAPADRILRTGSPTPEQKRLATRRHIIKELVETESKYGQDMKVVDDIYKGTSNIIVISAEDVKVLFGNSEQIVAFSTHFLDALKQAAKSVYVLPKSRRWKSQRDSVATSTSGNTDDQSSLNGPTDLTDEEMDRKTMIGEAFVHHMAELEKVYAEYLRNHDSANQKLASLQKNDKVKIWLKECQLYASDLTTAWDLDSLLVKPVQRILKYPLLLQSLLAQTPVNHPDFIALDNAAREIVAVSTRINEAKKRAEQFEQATNSGRRRKDFDTKKIKIKFPIKVPENVQDKEYDKVAEKFNLCFFQLQLVMRDVEDYNKKFVIEWASKWNEVVTAIEGYIDVGHPTYPEVESRYRKLRMSTREIMNTALPDHINAVRKSVIEPMVSLLRIYEGPQRLIKKRQKRMADYARYKVIKDRGDKLDKKTNEQGEQFLALNDTLKDELPKLFALTGKLVEACLQNYVHLQQKWQIIWKKKLLQVLDIEETPRLDSILSSFAGEFPFGRDEAHLLGIINGSLISEAGANLLNTISPSMTLNGDDSSSLRRPSTNTNDSRSRGLSGSSDVSPMLPQPDFGGRPDDTLGLGHLSSNGAYMANGYPLNAGRRNRATSAVSSRSPNTPEIAASYRLPTSSTMPASLHSNRPSTSTGRSTDPPSHLRLSVDNASRSRLSADSTLNRPPSNSTTSTYYTPSRDPAPARPSSPSYRNSNLFSSAMPMEDSPRALSPAGDDSQAAAAQPVREFNVLFLAASVYEFNIDRARREAGYPYLTYIAGEIFDVIGEKGELWLAKNQDDPTNTVGWIWNKHFAKLAS